MSLHITFCKFAANSNDIYLRKIFRVDPEGSDQINRLQFFTPGVMKKLPTIWSHCFQGWAFLKLL